LKLPLSAVLALAATVVSAQPAAERGVRVVTSENEVVDLYTGSYALLVGNGAYQDWDALRWPTEDVVKLSEVLEDLGFETEVVKNATADGFRTAMARFVSTHGQDEGAQLLFYFAGHGHTLPGATGPLGYVALTDTPDPVRDPAGFRARAIEMDAFLSYARQIRARHALFVFDSCFSGTVLRQRSGDATRALGKNVIRPVREFLTAGSADEPVPDKSLFKTVLVDVLTGAIPEPIEDGYLTGLELGALMKSTIPKYSMVQNPQYGRILDPELDKGDFVFVLKKAPAAAKGGGIELPDLRPDALLWQAKSAYTRRDYPSALTLFRESADLGSHEAMTFLGFLYHEGRGVPKDLDLALRWFESAAEKGNVSAMANLGYLASERRDYADAVSWLSRAVEAGDTAAMFNLGTMFLRGEGIERDYAKAYQLFYRGASNGDGASMNALAVLYANGLGVAPDERVAVEWHRRAADAGDASAMFNLGHLYTEGKIVPRDYDEARRLFLRAAKEGNASAMNGLGRMYHEGRGVKRDDGEAFRWFKRAADGGNPAAMNNLGYMFENGYGTKKDRECALSWYRRGAELKNAGALYNLGRFYEKGTSVEKDKAAALQLYREAAALGDEEAARRLRELGERH
jgi:TPR repeat protein